MSDEKKGFQPSGGGETSALFVKARKKQLAEQEAARKAAEEEAKRLAAEEEVRKLEEQIAQRKRQAEEEASRLAQEEEARKQGLPVPGPAAAPEAAAEGKPKGASQEKAAGTGAKQPASPGAGPKIGNPLKGMPSKGPDKKLLMFGGIGAAVLILIIIIAVATSRSGSKAEGTGEYSSTAISAMTYTDFVQMEEGEQKKLISDMLDEIREAGYPVAEDVTDAVYETIMSQEVTEEDMQQPGFLFMDILYISGISEEEITAIMEAYGFDMGGGTAEAAPGGELTEELYWNTDGGRTVYYPADVTAKVDQSSMLLIPASASESSTPWAIYLSCTDLRSGFWNPGELQDKEYVQGILNSYAETLMMNNTGLNITTVNTPTSEGLSAMNSLMTGIGTDSAGTQLTVMVDVRVAYWGSIYHSLMIVDENEGVDINAIKTLSNSILDGIE